MINHPWVGGGSWVGELVGVADIMKGYNNNNNNNNNKYISFPT
jgi:hypothetical protein